MENDCLPKKKKFKTATTTSKLNFLLIIEHCFSVTVTSPVWSQTTTRPTPLKPKRPSCPAVLLPATVGQASCLLQPRHASQCPLPALHVLRALPVARRASRDPSSMTILTFTLQRPRLPPVDPSAPWNQPLCPPSQRLTVFTSPSSSPSRL